MESRLGVVLGLLWAVGCGGKTDLGAGPSAAGYAGIGGTGGDAGSGGSTGGTGGTAGVGGTSGTSGSSGAAGTAGTGGTGPVIRTVIQRDPYEQIDVAHNLMLDGGFEFSGSMSAVWSPGYVGSMKYGNGFVCRTGIRCGILRPGDSIFGVFVSPEDGGMDVSLYAKTSSGNCAGLSLTVMDVYAVTGNTVAIESAVIGTDGWCEIKGWAPAVPQGYPVLYIEGAGEEVLVDDVVIRESEASPMSYPMAYQPISPALAKRLKVAAAVARADIERSRKRPITPRSVLPREVRIAPWLR
jgi:hypothetical protein